MSSRDDASTRHARAAAERVDRLFFDASREGMLEILRDDRGALQLLRCNLAAAAQLGATTGSLLGGPLAAAVGERAAALLSTACDRCESEGAAQFDVGAWSGRLLVAGPGVFAALLDPASGATEDPKWISLERERHFASAFAHAAIGMALVGVDGGFLKVNQAACEFWGYCEEELLQGSFQAITHPEDLEEDLRLVDSLLRGEIERYQIEKRYIHRSGAELWALLSVSLLREPDGSPRYFISQIQDITARKRTTGKLEETAALLSSVLHSSLDFIFIKDRELRTLMCNEAFASALGKGIDELIGNTDVENGWDPKLVYGDPETGAQGFIHDDRRALAGEVVHNPYDPAHVRGELRIFDTYKLPMRAADGEIIGVLGISRDVTERHEAEAKRLELERQVLHAQKLESLGVLAGGIAHDFNNLLTGIIGHLSLIEYDGDPDEVTASHVGGALEGASQAAALTQQMLAYSGRGRFTVTRVDITRVLASMRRLIDVSAARSCQLDLDLGHVPAIDGDEVQLRQIFMNLIINAAEATPRDGGRVTVRVGTRYFSESALADNRTGERLAAGDYVFCAVEDNGAGMSEEVLAKIFDPFFTTKFTGRGLGLAAALGIVRGHNGALLVRSAPGEGSRFVVAFPPAAAGADDDAAPPAESTPWRGRGAALVIDDEPAVRELSKQMFEALGFRALAAATGAQGVALLARAQAEISVVLLDLTMPDLDGVTTLRRIRGVSPQTPVILTSGYDTRAVSAQIRKLGVAGVLQKPYTIRAMIEVMRAALGDAPP